MNDDWNARVGAIWADDAMTDEERIAAIDALAAQRPAGDAVALFERAGARDSAGQEQAAEPLYRAALAAGLDDELRPQAVIQLASTLRNLGELDEALRLLQEEYEGAPDSPMRDAAAAFYALALVSAGDPVRGASIALTALAPHLTRYTRSVTEYARELRAPEA